MKLMTLAVPCYNSEEYMDKCLDTLLTGGEDVEIIAPEAVVERMRDLVESLKGIYG